MTNEIRNWIDEIVGRFCETPWRLTQTPYNVESVVIFP